MKKICYLIQRWVKYLKKSLKLLIGDTTRDIFIRFFIPLILACFYGSIALSILIFPYPFSIFLCTITDLGHPVLNPVGSILYLIAFWSFSILLIPMTLYMHKRLYRIFRIPTVIGTFFNFLAVISMFLLPLFPNTQGIYIILHAYFGFFSFFFLILGFCCYWAAMSRHKNVSIKKSAGMVLILIISGIMIGLSQAFLPLLFGLYLFRFFEWILLFALTIELVIISFYVPDYQVKIIIKNVFIGPILQPFSRNILSIKIQDKSPSDVLIPS